MSSSDTWAKLGEGVHPSRKQDAQGVDIDHVHKYRMHGVGAPAASPTNDPMGVPFADTESQFARTVPDALSSPMAASKFGMGDVVLHGATGALYGVLDVPDNNLVLERTGERAYMYRRIDGQDPRKWVRSQEEMEDGRFALHKRAPVARR